MLFNHHSESKNENDDTHLEKNYIEKHLAPLALSKGNHEMSQNYARKKSFEAT